MRSLMDHSNNNLDTSPSKKLKNTDKRMDSQKTNLKSSAGGGLRLTGKTIIESNHSYNHSMRTGTELNAIDKISHI